MCYTMNNRWNSQQSYPMLIKAAKDHQFKPYRQTLTVFAISGLQVSLLIRRELFERAKDFNIILDDVAITELSFSREYTAAVEAKQVGESGFPRAATRWRQLSVVLLSQQVFFCSPAGGAACSVLCGESQAGPETEDHPG